MKIAKIIIDSILGIEHLEINPGRVTIISGRNGLGKTSALDAVRAALGGGSDATLIRQGCESGETVVVLESGERIRRLITPEGTTLDVKKEIEGLSTRVTSKPKEWIKERMDGFGLNPLDLLRGNMPAAERTTILLGAIPATLDKESIDLALELAMVRPDLKQHPLKVFAALSKDLTEQRRTVNRDIKEKNSTVQQVLATVPEANDTNWANEVRMAEEELRGEDVKAREKAHEIDLAVSRAHEDLRAVHNQTVGEFQVQISTAISAFEDQVRAIEKQIAETRASLRSELATREIALQKLLAEATAEGQKGKDRLSADREPVLFSLSERVTLARKNAEDAVRADQVRKTAADMQTAADKLVARSERLSKALQSIERSKNDLLRNLPIKGIEIVDGEIQVDGLPFDRINEARRVRLAIEVAKLKAGGIPVICVDGIECLDSASFEEFRAAAEEADVQLIVTRVSDDAALKIEVQ